MENQPEPVPQGEEKQPEASPVLPGFEAVAQPVREKKCPVCGTVNPPQAVYCYKCGTKLPEVIVPDKKICQGCGLANELTSQYCYKCGLKLSDQPVTSSVVNFKPGGFWIRFVAILIDGVILAVVYSVIAAILLSTAFASQFNSFKVVFSPGFTGEQLSTVSLNALLYVYLWMGLIEVVVGIAYYTIAVGKWGKTFGKAAFGLKVLRADGAKVGFGRAFARYWGYVLNGCTLVIGFLVIAFNRKKQGLHDMVCDTIVVKTN